MSGDLAYRDSVKLFSRIVQFEKHPPTDGMSRSPIAKSNDFLDARMMCVSMGWAKDEELAAALLKLPRMKSVEVLDIKTGNRITVTK